MVRMGHDSPAAALIYQHSTRAADEAIAAALDAKLTARYLGVETECREGFSGPCGARSRWAKPARSGLMAVDQAI